MTEQTQETQTLETQTLETTGTVVNEAYQYMHSYTYSNGQVIAPIAVLDTVTDDVGLPSSQELNPVQIIELLQVAIPLLGTFAVNLTNLLNVGSVPPTADPATASSIEASSGDSSSDDTSSSDKQTIKETLKSLEDKIEKLGEILTVAKAIAGFVEVEEDVSKLEKKVGSIGEKLLSKFTGKDYSDDDSSDSSLSLSSLISPIIKEVIEIILGNAIKGILEAAGLYGEASSIRQFADQFQTLVVPNIVSLGDSDEAFAMMPVAGPNPLVIERITDSIPANFPVEDAAYKQIMGADDSIAEAISQNRLYLTDYKPLSVLEPGTFGGQKYISASLALFAIPKNSSNGHLKPVAIQVSQDPSESNPVLYPFHGETWSLGKAHVQAANGNYHELISHLGLTHLLVEPFAVSTHRMLDVDHPVFQLLLPHIQGTLFINNAAIASLVAPEGIVDLLLGGTIETDWQVTANALIEVNFDQRMLPNQLKDRNVADPALPLAYPYRDDALEVWGAIQEWVDDYVKIFYADDAAVAADNALQGWLSNLTSQDGGRINGLGETSADGTLGIYTISYLVDVLTMVIFTSSAQHASVNFPQRTIMSYTPTMPLATFAPAPTSVEGTASQSLLATLPPLQQAFVQLLLGQGLGGVYFTRLGDYNRHQRGNYFANTKVQAALEVFRDNLDKVESNIGNRNLNRASYQSLLPSRIPQSINI